ncbi:hypothetical protein ACSQ67_016486 [Phaseolus vulgaris]
MRALEAVQHGEHEFGVHWGPMVPVARRKFYHHLPSQQTLRSQQEVFNFLITGDIHLKDINKKAKQSDATAAEGSDLASYELSSRIEIYNID